MISLSTQEFATSIAINNNKYIKRTAQFAISDADYSEMKAKCVKLEYKTEKRYEK